MQEENVVLVNELDHEVGVMGKLEAKTQINGRDGNYSIFS